MIRKFHRLKRNALDLFKLRIWRVDDSEIPGYQRWLFRILRIISIVFSGIGANQIISRAAALSYSSLIAMGPLLAITFLVSSWFLVRGDENRAVTEMVRLAGYVFPQLTVGEIDDDTDPPQTHPIVQNDQDPTLQDLEEGAHLHGVDGEEILVNPEFLKLIENFLTPTRSGAITGIGSVILLVISIQLIISIENAFNQIWGIRRGREWAQRIVFYWAFISLGFIVTIALATLLTASTVANVVQDLPFGDTLLVLIRWMAPLLSFLLITGILASFYRFMPNTTVNFSAALIGAFVVAICLLLNNYFSYLYVGQVLRFQSLYGYTAIIPILMVGMYIFWLFILIGSQISYAVQNVDFLTKKEIWSNTSESTRELLGLAILIMVARQFRECLSPISVGDLATRLRVPGRVLNECLARLVDIRLINAVSSPDPEDRQVYYQPAKPLERIFLNDFKEAFERFGNNEGADLLLEHDPLLPFYREHVSDALQHSVGRVSLAELLAKKAPQLPA